MTEIQGHPEHLANYLTDSEPVEALHITEAELEGFVAQIEADRPEGAEEWLAGLTSSGELMHVDFMPGEDAYLDGTSKFRVSYTVPEAQGDGKRLVTEVLDAETREAKVTRSFAATLTLSEIGEAGAHLTLSRPDPKVPIVTPIIQELDPVMGIPIGDVRMELVHDISTLGET